MSHSYITGDVLQRISVLAFHPDEQWRAQLPPVADSLGRA
jgi:hypothetical protein